MPEDILDVAEDRIVGRIAGGEVDDLTPTQVRTIINVEDGAQVNEVTQAELDAHLNDTSDAHDASAISILDTANDFTATDVEGALAELQSDHESDSQALADHLADATAAHAASAISADSTTLVGVGTDVQAVLEELDNGIADHLADTSDAHDASAISVTPFGSIAATDVQAALQEIVSEGGGSEVSDTAYDATSWDGVTTIAPSKNAVRDKVELLAPLASPTFTGTPAAPTAAQGTNTTQIATTAYVQTEAGLLVPKSLFDANTILAANSDNTPVAVSVAEQTLLGRITGGNIDDLSIAQVRTLLGIGAVGLLASVAPTFQKKTVGSGTYTTPAGATFLIVFVQGAGGGGAAISGSATQAAQGGGGASGGLVIKMIASPAGSYSYVAGAKGTGGSAGTNNGNAGADSTFGSGGSLLTAKAGGGGITTSSGTSVAIAGAGGSPTTGSAGGDINKDGGTGQHGFRNSATSCLSGAGADSFFGGGGGFVFASNSGAAGNAASGYGAGGSGAAMASNNNNRAGGDGTDGVILVLEFYG